VVVVVVVVVVVGFFRLAQRLFAEPLLLLSQRQGCSAVVR
jgi:hypothetical protein